ncbi:MULTISPECIES: helix-turn-helix domain-containing protein [unclassified Streptomyces]|uniref:helix-turn-helix domain-containing protein n=1 Tax=unclassified Streptomyces TaxID=2593676 RepID=UPI003D72A2BE
MVEQVVPDAPGKHAPGDLGRRLGARRAQLGLTLGEAAARAGVAPGYLRYLEERPGAAPGTGVLLRLAEALETTMGELTGGNAEMPPGPGEAAPHPGFTVLTEPQCRALLGTHGVGRVALVLEHGPVVVPVNYAVVEGQVLYRTAPGTVASRVGGRRVAFEVDRIDNAFSRGWSVLVRGDARHVTDPETVGRLAALAYPSPWAGGLRELWVRIQPTKITGRRVVA